MRHFSSCYRCLNKATVHKIDKASQNVQRLVLPTQTSDSTLLRNVGIIAHVDAGKTTTTERLLFCCGMTEALGNVDEGTTVTDFMEQERARGITIQSAAVSMPWKQHRVNIIDTPGHVDFTMEVERALWVIDGAVGIIDAASGVEAQTKTVWRQANKFNLPRVIYINKMDRRGADVSLCLQSVRKSLKCTPLLIHHNIGIEKDFQGIVDVLAMKKLIWTQNSLPHDYTVSALTKADGSELYQKAIDVRNCLIDTVAELSPRAIEEILKFSSYDDIPADWLGKEIRSLVINNTGVPVLLGSSLKYRGTQPLLDAIINYLPSPMEARVPSSFSLTDDVCAFAFKTSHQKERGTVTFLRLFNGNIKAGSHLYNITQEQSEKIGKLYTILAEQLIETRTVYSGNILAVTGLENTVTGDILMSSAKLSNRMQKSGISLPSLTVPDPVFMCSIEPHSSGQLPKLLSALEQLAQDDPSLRVKHDTETDQIVVSGMGELHLDIVKDRLLREYNLNVYLGPMQVAYREKIAKTSPVVDHEMNRVISEIVHHVTISLSVKPSEDNSKVPLFVRTVDEDWQSLSWNNRKAINHGVLQALTSGPLLGFPVVNCEVSIHRFTLHSSKTSSAFISAVACDAVHKALGQADVHLLEPVMDLQINCEEGHCGDILNDLAMRRAIIENVTHKDEEVSIQAHSPVDTLVSFSSDLRRLSSGKATFLMEIRGFLAMSQNQTNDLVRKIKGTI